MFLLVARQSNFCWDPLLNLSARYRLRQSPRVFLIYHIDRPQLAVGMVTRSLSLCCSSRQISLLISIPAPHLVDLIVVNRPLMHRLYVTIGIRFRLRLSS